uniref:Uncharacterized protein n=1 Tax=Manihot esculenta TaxID=3983 RepID=A0A2C9VBQ0_MANES
MVPISGFTSSFFGVVSGPPQLLEQQLLFLSIFNLVFYSLIS